MCGVELFYTDNNNKKEMPFGLGFQAVSASYFWTDFWFLNILVELQILGLRYFQIQWAIFSSQP
jgi:hypothetical protein